MNNSIISFNSIKKIFNENKWQIGYLTHNELKENLNYPIKQYDIMNINNINKIYYSKQQLTGLLFVKNTTDYDYTMIKEISRLLKDNFNNLQFYDDIVINLKKAMVMSGLGQYGKNHLIYSYKFGFDIHIQLIITSNKIIDLPQRNKPNYNYLPQCKNCNDCIIKCPVGAIHDNWINYNLCDDFCAFGNHKNIPSMKWKWGKEIAEIPYSNELLSLIKNKEDCYNYTGQYCFPILEKNSYIIYPICRECSSQKKCSKYGGEYPYDTRYTLQ